MDFIVANAQRKKLEVFAVVRPHGMRGYIFLEAGNRTDAEQAAFNVPYARGILPKTVDYKEIEHMLEQVKHEVNIQKNDIVMMLSKSGNTPEIKVLIPLIKNFGNKIIGLTANNLSFLAKNADYILYTPMDKEACPNNP